MVVFKAYMRQRRSCRVVQFCNTDEGDKILLNSRLVIDIQNFQPQPQGFYASFDWFIGFAWHYVTHGLRRIRTKVRFNRTTDRAAAAASRFCQP